MSVSLPVFQNTPTIEQMDSIEYFGNTGVSEASDKYLYVAIIDGRDYVTIFNGSDIFSYKYYKAYVLYTKDNIECTRWTYAKNTKVLSTYKPWNSKTITYMGKRYDIATPFSGDNSNPIFASGCWANCPVYTNAADFFNTERPYSIDSKIPITYTTIGCTLDGPSEAESGEDVSVIVTPESGRIIREPIQGKSISVYDKNGYIPFTYTDGNLSFKVP